VDLVDHGIVKWNPEHECFTIEDKYKYILQDDYIDDLIEMINHHLPMDSVLDNILKDRKISNHKFNSLLHFNVSGKNSKSSKEDKYHYTVITEKFLLNSYRKYFQLYHNINGNFILYKEINNGTFYPRIKGYIRKFFEKSILSIFEQGKVGSVKEGKLFSEIIHSYKDDKGVVVDDMVIKCKTGPVCIIQSNLMSRYYYFYREQQKQVEQKKYRKTFPINGLAYMINYLEKNTKNKKLT
jgi:hypothetical protein